MLCARSSGVSSFFQYPPSSGPFGDGVVWNPEVHMHLYLQVMDISKLRAAAGPEFPR